MVQHRIEVFRAVQDRRKPLERASPPCLVRADHQDRRFAKARVERTARGRVQRAPAPRSPACRRCRRAQWRCRATAASRQPASISTPARVRSSDLFRHRTPRPRTRSAGRSMVVEQRRPRRSRSKQRGAAAGRPPGSGWRRCGMYFQLFRRAASGRPMATHPRQGPFLSAASPRPGRALPAGRGAASRWSGVKILFRLCDRHHDHLANDVGITVLFHLRAPARGPPDLMMRLSDMNSATTSGFGMWVEAGDLVMG